MRCRFKKSVHIANRRKENGKQIELKWWEEAQRLRETKVNKGIGKTKINGIGEKAGDQH